ncbi:hypothetical protein MHBO_000764 [Bonamia ostreae]|uniref:DNA endonuclease activator Ctp1 C-terminal domain-containing protein n=1 Tax=Bonamia ostreae TaxID=126728 RepID=A0ABV2AGT0_9EUKA
MAVINNKNLSCKNCKNFLEKLQNENRTLEQSLSSYIKENKLLKEKLSVLNKKIQKQIKTDILFKNNQTTQKVNKNEQKFQKISKNEQKSQKINKNEQNMKKVVLKDKTNILSVPETIRGHKRKELKGHCCKQCKNFYDSKITGANIVKSVDELSRHRVNNKIPSTPPWYWDLSSD